jgi:CTP:molybdopterin cytidylyltransferase MocA
VTRVAGLLLAAGAGRRMGGPKALLRTGPGAETFLARAVRALDEGGCDETLVVLGAGAADARPLLAGADVQIVEAADWEEGLGASLRAGLGALTETPADTAIITLVDLPDVGARVFARVLAIAGAEPRAALARAAYAGVPGHPVLIGRDHWQGAIDAAAGDRGARDYLSAHEHLMVECGDLATGRDVDTPDQL